MTARTLLTTRLKLVPLRPDHAEAALRGFADPLLYTFMPGAPRTDAESLREYFARLAAGSRNGDEEWLNWLAFARSSGDCIGWFQATVVRRHSASIAYAVFAAWQRQGHAREGVAAMIESLRRTPTLREIVAQADVRNAASLRVAEALGFVRDAAPVPSSLRGEATLDCCYRMTIGPTCAE